MATIVVLPDSFEMPSKCIGCWFVDWNSQSPVCRAMGFKRVDCPERVPRWCPLRSVRIERIVEHDIKIAYSAGNSERMREVTETISGEIERLTAL